jgi:hypothetical protein
MVLGRRLPLPNGQSLHPAGASHRAEPQITRHQRRFKRFTRPVFPSPVAPGWNGRPWASTPSFEPRRYQRRTSGWGQASSTGPGLRCRHRSTLRSASPLILCDLVSQPQVLIIAHLVGAAPLVARAQSGGACQGRPGRPYSVAAVAGPSPTLRRLGQAPRQRAPQQEEKPWASRLPVASRSSATAPVEPASSPPASWRRCCAVSLRSPTRTSSWARTPATTPRYGGSPPTARWC